MHPPKTVLRDGTSPKIKYDATMLYGVSSPEMILAVCGLIFLSPLMKSEWEIAVNITPSNARRAMFCGENTGFMMNRAGSNVINAKDCS